MWVGITRASLPPITEKVEITSIDQIPSEWVDTIKTSLQTQKQQDSYNQWLEEITEAADIKVNDMPQGLPYDLDMSKYEAAKSDEGATDGAADGAADGATDGSDATDGATDGSDATDGATDGTADNADAADGAADAADTADGGSATSDQPAEAA